MTVSYLGDYDTAETVIIPFNTFSSDDPSSSVTITDLVADDVKIHKDAGLTQRANSNGITVSVDYDGITGNHIIAIDLSDNSDAGFYADGYRYQVRIEGATVDGATAGINTWVGSFSVGCVLRPATAGRKLNVAADGDIGGNVDGSVGSVVGHTPQTGDAYAIVNNGTYGSSKLADHLTDIKGTGFVKDTDSLIDLSHKAGTKGSDNIYDDTNELQTDWVNGGRLDVLVDAIKSVTDTLPDSGALTTLITHLTDIKGSGFAKDTHSLTDILQDVTGINGDVMRGTDSALTDKAGFSLSTAGILAIWHQALSAVVTAGSVGKLLKDEITSARMAILTDWIDAGRLDSILDSVKAVTDAIPNSGALTDIVTHLTDIKGATFNSSTDSLEAVRDRGDAAWVTGGGGSISDILDIHYSIPNSVDLADTATVRAAIMLTNAVDDLPSTAEIDPGTVDIHRKAMGGTSWSVVVNGAACSESAGMIYYDEVFNAGSGYAQGDTVRYTFKGQKITVAANDYEIVDAVGVMFYTYIRQAMRGTDSANTTTPPTVEQIRTEIDDNSTKLASIVADTNELQTDWTNAGRLDAILDELTVQGDSNESKLDIIDTVVDGVQTDLDNATDGLGALKILIDAVKTITDVLPDSGALTTISNNIIAMQGSGFVEGTDSLEAIRNRGDVAWISEEGSNRLMMIDTTIATLGGQTSFNLTDGSPNDNAYVGCTIIVEDAILPAQKSIGVVSAYTGSSKQVTLAYDPQVFTIDAGDKVYIIAEANLKPTVANRRLNVAADGDIGGNVDGSVNSVVGHTAQTGDSYAVVTNGVYGLDKLVRATTPANTLDIDSNGEVTAENMRGTDSAALASVCTEGRLAELDSGNLPTDVANVKSDTGNLILRLGDYAGSGLNTVKGFLQAMFRKDAGISGANIPSEINENENGTTGTYDPTTDSIEAIRDRGDAAWISGGGGGITVEQIRTEMDDNSTKLATIASSTSQILADTADMQPKIGTPAGASIAADIADVKTDTGTVIVSKVDDIDSVVDSVLTLITALDTLTKSGGTGDLAAIKARLDVVGVPKNTAFNNFPILMRSSADHVSGVAGVSVAAQLQKDGGSWVSATNSVVETGNGLYSINITSAELNAKVVTFLFTGTGADPTRVTLITT